MKENNQDEVTISFKELKNSCKKGKKTILLSVVICTFLTFFYAITRPIHYTAEGTFKEKGKAHNGLNSFAGLLSAGGSQDSNAIALMKSRTMREKLAKSLNYQVKISNPFEKESVLRNIWENILFETRQFLYPHYPSLTKIESPFEIQGLIYTNESPLTLSLKLISANEFEILENGKKAIGKVGVPFVSDEYTFTLLNRQNKSAEFEKMKGQSFNLTFLSLGQAAKMIADRLTIVQDKIDKNLLNIKFKSPNRHFAAKAVNELMSIYKNYLKNEQQITISHQIEYLEKRQQEIGKKLKSSMESHVLKISEDIKNIGFPNTQLAMEFLTESQNSLQKKLLDIEFELKRLQNSQKAGYVYYDTYNLPGDPAIINQMLAEMRELKKQKSSLNLKMMEEKSEQFSNDLKGIDLKTAQDLFVSYTHKLNEIESQILQNKFLIGKMGQEDFELSSLGTILNDKVSLDMSQRATELAMNLKDSNNRSLKEQELIREDLALQKRFLSTHLYNGNELLSLNQKLMQENVKTLQQATFAILKEQISLLDSNLTDYIKNRIENLKAEAEIIEQHKMSLMNQMSALPSKWVSEKLINLEMEVNQKMVEEVSKLVETKNIGNNLELIQSHVIDEGIAPLHPDSSRPFLFAILGAMIGGLFSSLYIVFSDIAKKAQEDEDERKSLQREEMLKVQSIN